MFLASHTQSTAASAEFGNVQGAVINVVTRQGSARLLYDASYYSQTAGLTSQPVLRRLGGSGTAQSGYERDRYRDLTTNLGGPVVRDRAWFFIGYQYLRDYDSQPGTDPDLPRAYEQNKVFAKLTWQPALLNLNGSDVSTILIDPRLGMADRPDGLARKGSNLYATALGKGLRGYFFGAPPAGCGLGPVHVHD